MNLVNRQDMQEIVLKRVGCKGYRISQNVRDEFANKPFGSGRASSFSSFQSCLDHWGESLFYENLIPLGVLVQRLFK